jgi:hypothetical protein
MTIAASNFSTFPHNHFSKTHGKSFVFFSGEVKRALAILSRIRHSQLC